VLRETLNQADCAIIVNPTFYDPENTKYTLSNIATTQILCFHTPSTLCGPSRPAASGQADYLFRAIDLCRSRRPVLSSAGPRGAAPRDILLGVAEPDAECVRDSIAIGRIVLQAVGDVRGLPTGTFGT